MSISKTSHFQSSFERLFHEVPKHTQDLILHDENAVAVNLCMNKPC